MVAKYKKLFFAFSALAVSLSAVFLLVEPVSADYTPTNGKCNGTDALYEVQEGGQTVQKCKGTSGQLPSGSTSDSQNDATTDKDVTCAVEKVGWIVCPILESMAKISDSMFDVLADNFLRTDTALFRDDSGTKVAWEIARNLANVMFIIAFLVIIISQVTSMGISNYGIKKMLPRLVIAAIAVNVSYYICQLVVDLTNIFGYEIQNALVQVANNVGPSVFGNASSFGVSNTGNGATDTGVLTVIAVAALASAAVWLILGPGLAVITVVIVTVLAILIILMLRKALIVLLIVVSPIAFVLYLLPNTEKFFSKWMKMFGQLLMVFPVVGLLFGAGQLASTIILVSGATVPQTTDTKTCDANTQTASTGGIGKSAGSYDGKCDGYINISGTRENPGDTGKVIPGGRAASWTLGLVAVGVAIAPLMAVYAVLKGALSAAGAIGGQISSMTSKARGGAGRWGKGVDERRQKRAEAAALRGGRLGTGINIATLGRARRNARRGAIDKNLDRELNMARMDYTSQQALDSEAFQRQLAGGSMIPGTANQGAVDRAKANALFQRKALDDEERKAAHALVDKMEVDDILSIDGAGNLSGQLVGADVNSARTAAMIERAFDAGSGDVKAAIIDAFRNAKDTFAARTVAERMSANNPGYWTAQYTDEVSRGVAGANIDPNTGRDMNSATNQAIEAIAQNRFGAEKLVSASGNDAGWVNKITQGHQAAREKLQAAAQEVLSNDQLRGRMRNNQPHIESMANAQRPQS